MCGSGDCAAADLERPAARTRTIAIVFRFIDRPFRPRWAVYALYVPRNGSAHFGCARRRSEELRPLPDEIAQSVRNHRALPGRVRSPSDAGVETARSAGQVPVQGGMAQDLGHHLLHLDQHGRHPGHRADARIRRHAGVAKDARFLPGRQPRDNGSTAEAFRSSAATASAEAPASVVARIVKADSAGDRSVAKARACQFLWRCGCSGIGAGVPSDQRRTGTKRTVDSSGLPSLPITGEPSRFGAQSAARPCGRKNMT